MKNDDPELIVRSPNMPDWFYGELVEKMGVPALTVFLRLSAEADVDGIFETERIRQLLQTSSSPPDLNETLRQLVSFRLVAPLYDRTGPVIMGPSWLVVRAMGSFKKEPPESANRVYFVAECQSRTDETVTAIKIGTSRSPTDRASTLRTANPRPLHLIATISGTARLERRLHDHFAPWRIRGEWFEPCLELSGLVRMFHDIEARDIAERKSSP